MASVRRWDDLIEEGRQLKVMEERIDAEHGNVRWQWGDLAREVAPMGEDHAKTGSYDDLRRFADELDVSFESLRQYRTVAEKWPDGMRVPSQPWVVHQQIMGRDDREELIASPVDVRTGEAMDRWTFRAMQRFLGQKPSPHYRKPPQTSAEKLTEIKGMVATVGDDEATEFIDHVVDILEALDERTERTGSDPKPPVPLSERWEKAIGQLDKVLTTLAKLNNETDQADVELTGHAAAARYLYERIAEKKLEAEIRQFFDAEELA